MDREQLLDEIVTAYLKAVEAGQQPDQAELLARHPDLADELREFFAAQKSIDNAAAQMRGHATTLVHAGEVPRRARSEAPATAGWVLACTEHTLALGEAPANPGLGTIRYFGDYELLEEIARGGMGVVYKARQVSLNRIVALKMILAGQLASPADVKRFRTEAEAAANLQHPNIVAIHEVGEHDGHHFFSMDYVEGRDLGALLKNGPLPARPAASYVKIIAEAIHFAHQRGTLHRDVKPQNVLIDAADQPRITDFGLAKIMKEDGRMTQSGVIMGTPSYMPPEQACGRQGDIGPPSDVYSLGAMLYELLTGRPPFRGATAMDTLLEVIEAEPTAPRLLRVDIPPDLETICLKCLEKAPAARYPTAVALADELERFLHREPIQARPASAVRKVVSWARRHPQALAAVAALVIVALICGAFYLFEENAFLRAQQADPTLAQVPGWRHDFLLFWNGWIFLIVVLGGMWRSGLLNSRTRGLPSKQVRDTGALHARPLGPLDERTRKFAIGTGLIQIAYGIFLLVTVIQAHVLEGESILAVCICYFPISFGTLILIMVIRDYQLVQYGISSSSDYQLSAEQLAPICRALEDQDWPAAIKLYRDAVPEAGWAAPTNVQRLFKSLQAQYPGKFRPRSLATLNWKIMGIFTLIEALILGISWIVVTPTHRAADVTIFAMGFLFAMGYTAGLRVRGWQKRLLLLVPALALMTFARVMRTNLVNYVPDLFPLDTMGGEEKIAGEIYRFIGVGLGGCLFGASLMLSGFKGPLVQRVSGV